MIKFQSLSGCYSKGPESLLVRHTTTLLVYTLCLCLLLTRAKGCKLWKHLARPSDMTTFKQARQSWTVRTMRVPVVNNVGYKLLNRLLSGWKS